MKTGTGLAVIAIGGSEASGRTATRDLSTEPIPGDTEIVEDVYED